MSPNSEDNACQMMPTLQPQQMVSFSISGDFILRLSFVWGAHFFHWGEGVQGVRGSKPRIINSVAHACRSLKHLRWFFYPHFRVRLPQNMEIAYLAIFNNLKRVINVFFNTFFVANLFRFLTVYHTYSIYL